MKTIIARRPDVAFYLKIFLLNPDPDKHQVATSIVCSKSPAMLEDAYEQKTIPKQECATKEIDENIAFAEENGISAAPALIFPDGTLQFGFSEAAGIEKRIDEAAGKQKATSKKP